MRIVTTSNPALMIGAVPNPGRDMDFFSNLQERASELVAAAGAGLVAAGLAIQKFRKSWNADSAENQVIVLLREEVERLSAQNTALAKNLNSMQQMVGQFQREKLELQAQVHKLTTEVNRLRAAERLRLSKRD